MRWKSPTSAVSICRHMPRKALAENSWETIKPGDPVLTDATFDLIARPADAQKAAADAARIAGIEPIMLGANLEGEARDLGRKHAQLAKSSSPGVIISGGETTVTVSGEHGRGGRNCEYLLALAITLEQRPRHPRHRMRYRRYRRNRGRCRRSNRTRYAEPCLRGGLDATAMLYGHDSYTFFDVLDDLIRTGPHANEYQRFPPS